MTSDYTKRICLILLFWICKMGSISSEPYCEFDSCNETQYCCAQYTCCPKPNGNVLIMAWILATLIIIGIALGALYKCKSRLYRLFSRGSESEALNPYI